VGPQDTPYDGFLFWFDLQLPETYPSEPPSMHYHACCCVEINQCVGCTR